MENHPLSLVAVFGARTRALSKNDRLLWKIPEDMARFKEKTEHHPVIMGRKTWESLPAKFRPLPNRTNIVITRNPEYVADGAWVVDSLDAAIAHATAAPGAEEIFIMGGGEIYAASLPRVSTLYLTLVDSDDEGDVFFPTFDESLYSVIEERDGKTESGLSYQFKTLQR